MALKSKNTFCILFLLILFPMISWAGNKENKDSINYFPIFDIQPILGVNSKGLDFSPVMMDGKLVFISEREIDVINLGESQFTKNSYLSIQVVKLLSDSDTMTFSKPKVMSNKISQLTHSGPISFNKEGDFAIFTRVTICKVDNQKIYNPQLFSASKKRGIWSNIKKLNINQPTHSFGHPALSSDGKELYFVSDMTGGLGGNDIYYSKLSDEGWSAPVNLGKEINSPGNEVFPFYYKDSLLFFSSDGHVGFGGLDLFFTPKNNVDAINLRHLDNSINTSADEFGIFLQGNSSRGFLSSNRSNGKGGDDIYGLNVDWINLNMKTKRISGIFEYKSLPGKKYTGIQVFLINEEGTIVYSTTTDEKGYFEFDNLPYDEIYAIKSQQVENSDILLYIVDEKSNIVAELSSNKEGIFLYKKLAHKDFKYLDFLYNIDTLSMVDGKFQKSIKGKLIYESLPYKESEGVKVFLINDVGEIMFTAMTNKDGEFIFENLPFSANYTIMTEEEYADAKLLIMKDERVVAIMKGNNKGNFVYLELPYDMVNTLALMNLKEDEMALFNGFKKNSFYEIGQVDSIGEQTKSLSGQILYEKLPFKDASGIKVMLVNELGEVMYVTTTDKDGKFIFSNLPFKGEYIVKTEEAIQDAKLIIMKDNKAIAILTSNKNGKFLYLGLPYDMVNSLSLMSLSDDKMMLYRGANVIPPGIESEQTAAVISEENKTAFVYDLLAYQKSDMPGLLSGNAPGLCPESFNLPKEEINECIDITINDLLNAVEDKVNEATEKVIPPIATVVETVEQKSYEMESIYFDFNDYKIKNTANNSLVKLVSLLSQDQKLSIKINGYSDSQGSDGHNMELSKSRSRSVVNYFLNKGIDNSRLTSMWYGEKNQANNCGENCTEDQHQLNRRVELILFNQ